MVSARTRKALTPKQRAKEEREEARENLDDIAKELQELEKHFKIPEDAKQKKAHKKKMMGKTAPESDGEGSGMVDVGAGGEDDATDAAEAAAAAEYRREVEALRSIKAAHGAASGGKSGTKERVAPAGGAPSANRQAKAVSFSNAAGLLSRLSQFALSNVYPGKTVPFIETLTHTASVNAEDVSPEDDLAREAAFERQALQSVLAAKELIERAKVPFWRPKDYFAEMIKTDEQMLKIRKKLILTQESAKAAQDARSQRERRKFGKQVQVAKLQERAKQKRDTLDKIDKLKKRPKGDKGEADADAFDIELDMDGDDGKASAHKRGRRNEAKAAADARGGGTSRAARDAKYGFGGKKRHNKSNTRESLDNMPEYSVRKMKNGGGVSKGRGGSGKKRSGAAQKRPGKARRAATRKSSN